MSGCLDNVNCECIDLSERRNAVASILAGLLFFTGWWIIIDVMATAGDNFSNWYYIVGVVGTVSMFMINAVSNSHVRGEAMTDSALGSKGARVWLLLGFVAGFGAVIAAVWIMFGAYVLPAHTASAWPGVALFLQNFLIFAGSLTYKFGRLEDMWG